jgi:amidohydrolase
MEYGVDRFFQYSNTPSLHYSFNPCSTRKEADTMTSRRAGAIPTEAVPRLVAWEPLIDQHAAELEARLVEARRHLHAHPEASCEERETTQYLAERLAEARIDARTCRDGLGVIADLDVGTVTDVTPRIALRADIDALRIPDAKTTPYASQHPGLCHACGHDAHSAMVLGAAWCGARLRQSGPPSDDVPGMRLRFLFQPAEEESLGAQWLVEQGAVDGVDAILGLHVDPERTLGTVGIRYGVLTATCDDVEIVIEGKGGHAARPHHTRDPIAAAGQLITALYQFLPRSVDPRTASVFTIGRIAGGTLPNVIPERVELVGTLRTLDEQHRQCLKERIEDIVHGCRETSGTTIHLRFFCPVGAVVNNRRVTGALEAASRRVVGDDGIQSIELPSMGGEDFSAYLTKVPGAMLRIGCAPPGFTAPFLHAPNFDVDERVLALGTRILLRTAVLLAAQPRVADEAGQI